MSRGRIWARGAGGVFVFLLVAAVGCNPGGHSTGGITIPQSDNSPPEASLQVAATVGTGEGSVSAGGSGTSFTISAKTGNLNIAATAKDPQSGVRELQVFMTKAVTVCAGDLCSGGTHPAATQPVFASTGPTKAPGQQVSESSLLLNFIDLATQIPQAPPSPGHSRHTEFRFFVKATNYLGGTAQTPTLEVRHSETGQ
jgi:hypothetical protein